MAGAALRGGMTVVDTGIWADFFNGASNPYVDRLDTALADHEDLGVTPIIMTEVLQGFRTATGFEQARSLLVTLPVLCPSIDIHVRAARLFRQLRQKGVTVRGAVDCVIAQTCIEAGAELLTSDSAFKHIAHHTPLRLWRHAPA